MIFKRFFKWLKTKLSRRSAIDEAQELHIPVGVGVVPNENIKEDYAVEVGFDAELPGRGDTQEPGPSVLMPDIYAEKPVSTDPKLEILDRSSPDAVKSTGFDPYDTIVLHKKTVRKER